MNQRDAADRFSRDVDHLLHEAGLTEPGSPSSDYDELLKLAQRLAGTDFSSDSQIRPSLRRKLLNQIEQTPVTMVEIPGPLSLIKQLLKARPLRPGYPLSPWKNRLILAALTGLIVLISVMAVASDLRLRPRLVDLVAQVLAYLPLEREIEPHSLELRWQFRAEDGLNSAPVAAGGVIYAGSNEGYLYALEARSGAELWRFQSGGSLNLAPAVAPGTVYAANQEGDLYAVDSRTGRQKWRFRADDAFSLGPIVGSGLVLAGTESGDLYALEAGTAREIWRFKAGDALLPQATAAGPTLYLSSRDHHVYALELETGQEKWRFRAGDWLSTRPIEVAGLVYVGSHDEHLYVLDARTGQEQQRYALGNKVRTSAALAGNTLYFGSYDSYLHAVDGPTGQEKWRFKMGKQTLSSPVVVEGVIYIGSGDGYLYEVDARTGTEIARYGVDSQIYTAPTVVDDTIYFVSGKGTLYAVQKNALSPGQAPPLTGAAATTEPAGFQFTPGGWYVEGQAEAIHFRGRMVDGAGRPVDGFRVQADNGSTSFLSAPSGPNPRQPQARAGEWEIVIPGAERNAGWWWLTAVRAECSAGEAGLEAQCQTVTRLSESVKVKIVVPDETVINADWTCQWQCRPAGEK